MKGWVNPEDVNFGNTLALDKYDESELRLNVGAPVQIDEIVVYRGEYENRKLPLKGPIVVPA